ncbi:lasso peptide biosynthesis B2 protein [Sphingomonas sp. HMWF008]|nr:lasso peptide biosynthesis B2 protein [Sphingomonas sp. HMWF008]
MNSSARTRRASPTTDWVGARQCAARRSSPGAPSMTIGLRSGVSFCEVGDRLIFLDVRADRYFGLGASAELAFRRAMAEFPVDKDDPPIAPLLERGILVDRAPFAPRACPAPAAASESLLDLDRPRVAIHSLLGACGALAAARATLRWTGLASTLEQVRGSGVRKPAVASAFDRLLEVAAAFDQSARLMRSHDQCLARSIAIMHRLASLGVAAELVIGVRVRPFAAHCWVQQGPRLISDRVDQVRSYTPILVL